MFLDFPLNFDYFQYIYVHCSSQISPGDMSDPDEPFPTPISDNEDIPSEDNSCVEVERESDEPESVGQVTSQHDEESSLSDSDSEESSPERSSSWRRRNQKRKKKRGRCKCGMHKKGMCPLDVKPNFVLTETEGSVSDVQVGIVFHVSSYIQTCTDPRFCTLSSNQDRSQFPNGLPA